MQNRGGIPIDTIFTAPETVMGMIIDQTRCHQASRCINDLPVTGRARIYRGINDFPLHQGHIFPDQPMGCRIIEQSIPD